MRKLIIPAVLAAVLALVSGAAAQETTVFESNYNAVLSRLQSMGHGYYSQQEWAEVEQRVNDLMADAAQRRDGEAIVRVERVDLGDQRYVLSPYETDQLTYRIVRLLNRHGAR